MEVKGELMIKSEVMEELWKESEVKEEIDIKHESLDVDESVYVNSVNEGNCATMSEARNKGDEKPLKLKPLKAVKRKQKKTNDLACIIHYHLNKSDTKVRPLSEDSFQKIKDTIELRQLQSSFSDRLPDICSQVPNMFLSHLHGYHRWCYQNFTNTSRLLKKKRLSSDDAPSTSKRCKTSQQSSTTVLLPADECLFCGKNGVARQRKEEKLVKCGTKTAKESIKKAAKEKQDDAILLKVQGIDLVAREAYYHSSCWKAYTQGDDTRRKKTTANIQAMDEHSAHDAAFQYVAHYVEKSVFEGGNVERMTVLEDKYQQFMLENFPQFFHDDFLTAILKSKLVRKFDRGLRFFDRSFKSEYVFSSTVPTGTAVESALEVSPSDSRLEDAALVLRRQIQKAQLKSQSMPWPDSGSFLLTNKIQPPQSLKNFLCEVVTGKMLHASSGRTKQLVKSFAQDICHAATFESHGQHL